MAASSVAWMAAQQDPSPVFPMAWALSYVTPQGAD